MSYEYDIAKGVSRLGCRDRNVTAVFRPEFRHGVTLGVFGRRG
jgi:hypothetical protein